MIAGPVSFYKVTEDQAERFLKQLGQPTEVKDKFLRWIRKFPVCNIDRFLESLKLLAGILKVPTNSIKSLDFMPVNSTSEFENYRFLYQMGMEYDMNVERTIVRAVESGDIKWMQSFLNQPVLSHGMEPGELASDTLRSIKTTFIMSTSILSRAALKGGLDYTTILTLCEDYFLLVNRLNSYQEVMNLIRHMFLDFTTRVAKVKSAPADDLLVKRCCRYIHANLSRKITAADLAKVLHRNPDYICRHFRQTTGLTISDYISRERVAQAKQLLTDTDLPIAVIASHIGFSSSQYFYTVFKKISGITPGEYRSKEAGSLPPLC